MTRRQIPPRRVEALAKECAEMLRWLRGPGAAASESEYKARFRAYKALCEAVAFLPRGPSLLKQFGGLVVRKKPMQPTTQRAAESFTADELALLDEPVLTPDGWLVPPQPLVMHVDRVRDELRESGAESGTKQALRKILERAAVASNRSVLASLKDLPKLEAKVSRQRNRAITERSQKVPPEDKTL